MARAPWAEPPRPRAARPPLPGLRPPPPRPLPRRARLPARHCTPIWRRPPARRERDSGAAARPSRQLGGDALVLVAAEDLAGDVLTHQLLTRDAEIARGLREAIGQHARELPQQLDRQAVLGAQDLEEVLAMDHHQLRGAQRARRGGARLIADQRHLAEVLAWIEPRDGGAGAHHLDLPAEHDVE